VLSDVWIVEALLWLWASFSLFDCSIILLCGQVADKARYNTIARAVGAELEQDTRLDEARWAKRRARAARSAARLKVWLIEVQCTAALPAPGGVADLYYMVC